MDTIKISDGSLQRGQLGWLGAIAVACMAYVGHEGFITANGVGYLAGFALTISLGAWALFQFAVLKREQRARGWVYLLVLYGLAVSAGIGAAAFQKHQMQVVSGSMRRVVDAAATGAVVGSEPQAVGPMGALQRVVLDMNAQNASDQAEYSAAVEKTGVLGLLDPQRISTDPTLQGADESIRNAREAVKTYRSRFADRLRNARAQLEKADLPEDLRADALHGFDEGLQRVRPVQEAIWNDEAAVVDQIGDVVGFLKSSQGQWKVVGGRFEFANNEALAGFNQRVERVQAVARHEDGLRQRLIQANRSKVDEMSAALK